MARKADSFARIAAGLDKMKLYTKPVRLSSEIFDVFQKISYSVLTTTIYSIPKVERHKGW